MAFEYDDLVGTGETYTSPQAWEDARNTSGVWTGDRRLRLKGEEFTGSDDWFLISGGGDTSGVYNLVVEADTGVEHDGRFHANSAAGNARLRTTSSSSANNGTIRIQQPRVKVGWLELINNDEGLTINKESNDDIEIHHCLLSSTATSSAGTIKHEGGTGFKCYRNAGCSPEIQSNFIEGTISNAKILHNTFLGCKQFNNGGTLDEVKQNVAFLTDSSCYTSATQNQGENAADDNTGDSGFDSLSPSGELVAPTLDTSTFDPILWTSGTLYRASTATYSSGTYPEIDYPLNDRTQTIPSGVDWSIGAVDIISGTIIDFERYVSGYLLSNQYWYHQPAQGQAEHCVSVDYSGTRCARMDTHGPTYIGYDGMYPEIDASGILELKWRWASSNTSSKIGFGNTKNFTDGNGTWLDFCARIIMEDGGFNAKGTSWANTTGWPTLSSGVWYYMRLVVDYAALTYDLYYDTASDRSSETQLVDGDGIPSGGIGRSSVGMKANIDSVGYYTYIDDIQWNYGGASGVAPPTPSGQIIIMPYGYGRNYGLAYGLGQH